MDEDAPEEEPEKLRFLLPEGCKDLIDALRQEQQREAEAALGEIAWESEEFKGPPPTSVVLPDPVKLSILARMLRRKPFEVIGVLMKNNAFCSLHTPVDFPAAAAVCAFYGVTASKAA